ncbi:50S ribosomal protein L3 [Acanthopleuribacter pedis]|uniref:Large ribosomal subunit protein uL3 n=1 Tax=Acanthopleuribacter pedis TaxID=442870 RepID=A0A8J7U6T6_9BACT|nr:50S ribosomal protein L3 [Acanthopleuribacter pedis]MBO1322274.1 50S ribosomal protein L3 [Acanthopleuribacter pedis]
MIKGILGKKLGMTQVYDDSGRVVPVTVIEAGPCVVTQVKTLENDGYTAAQIGLVEKKAPKKQSKAEQGHLKKNNIAPMRHLKEFRIDAGDAVNVGDQVLVNSFEVDEKIHVTATSQGKGFQGVIKRHGFGGGRMTHGSHFKRAPGSIGQCATPSRVFPGKKLPGHMGAKKVTVKNLKIVQVIEDQNLLLVKGAVPGAKGGLVAIRKG